MEKRAFFKVKGMQIDLSSSSFNSEYAYSIQNMRLTPIDKGTLMSLSNEKGPSKINIINLSNDLTGTPIGQAIIGTDLIIFTTIEGSSSSTKDFIYRIQAVTNTSVYGSVLYKGNLNFNVNSPIETLPFYENSKLKKVYWTDGRNPPRVINIEALLTERNKWDNNSFNFVRKLKLREIISVSKYNSSGGSFASGTIQYAFTYFDKYKQESNIFYVSPLYYISYYNRGASPEENVSNSFKIVIRECDTSWDYLRIYSIHRTSIDSIPVVKRVVDLATSSSNMYYTDTGDYGDSIDPTELLYIGGEEIIVGTMAQKDNTLFLGNIKINKPALDSTVKAAFNNGTINWNYIKELSSPEVFGYYPYLNQLDGSSTGVKVFKYLEWYRFGLQFQHYTGKWSEPVWINDARNTLPIKSNFFDNSNLSLATPVYTLTNDNGIIDYLISLGYLRVRPVVVYPSLNDRECVCQGVLCPTVYNVGDRYSNSPFSQSSWFIRPYIPFDVFKSDNTNGGPDWNSLVSASDDKPTIYSKKGIISLYKTSVTKEGIDYTIDPVNKGTWLEFRHNYPIPDNSYRNAEIQCISNPPSNPLITAKNDFEIASYVSKHSENFYVDQSILTFHSPDIEFDDSAKNINSGLKLRIVGIVPVTSFCGDINIQTSTPVTNFLNSSDLPIGFYKEPIGVENQFDYASSIPPYDIQAGNSHFGFRSLASGAFWFDEAVDYVSGHKNEGKYSTGFVVYPWHRNGSLNNARTATDGYRPAMLDKKRMSNLKYSYKSIYLDSSYVWEAYKDNDDIKTGISGVSIFDSNEVSMIKIPAPENSTLSDLNYYGNIDKLINFPRIGDKAKGYPIIVSGFNSAATNAHDIFNGNYIKLSSSDTNSTTGIDPIRMKYKSTPHAVLALNYTKIGKARVLPTLRDSNAKGTYWEINSMSSDPPENIKAFYFWDRDKKPFSGIYQDYIEYIDPGESIYQRGLCYGWLWLGELYRDVDTTTLFGGKTEEAFENNIWIPAGPSMALTTPNGTAVSSTSIRYYEGDTYYQRYDCLKTYPFSSEDQNQMTEILSFMCETKINLDGRYDRNRGQNTNFTVSPTNFNLLNPAYNQKNNFFTYRAVNSNKLNLNTFNNTITWTKTKTLGELVDTWTNITLASTLDLDGDKGEIRALKRFSNNIIAFQDKGLSQILYNENTQISTTEGVPIEIANSGKVTGKRYFSNNIGCINKWSICETPNGLYFMDDLTKGIYLFNGQLNNISDKFGFHSWTNKYLKSISWNPKNFEGFITHYDEINGDVFFINKDYCLAFSEPLGSFSSFYSYSNTPLFANVNGNRIWVRNDGTLWYHQRGDYNYFFGSFNSFSVTILVNPEPTEDKIFNTVTFRSDTYDSNNNLLSDTTFTGLNVYNEYQTGYTSLTYKADTLATLKKKFRIWKASIPRDKNSRNRIRNTWTKLKLEMTRGNTHRTILHDLEVYYTI